MLEKKHFNGGLNYDDEDRVIPNGDYRYALNIRSGGSDNASSGAIENNKGNTLVPNVNLPSGSNKVIGSLDYKLINKVYYFVWNQFDNHSIFEFNPSSNTIDTIFQDSILNFDENGLILSPQIIGGDLYFTDDINEPRSINIERGRNFFQNSIVGVANGSFETPVKEQDILLIKYPPQYPPLNEYLTDHTVDYNNLKGNLYQFQYQYTYYGGTNSAWSEFSKRPIPDGDDLGANINQVGRERINNVIRVDVNSGDALVRSVRIAVRRIGGDDVELNDDPVLWKEIITHNDSNISMNDDYGNPVIPNTIISYNFFNDDVHLPIEDDNNTRLFNNVPYKAKDMALINGSRIGLFNIEDGNDNVDNPSIKTQVIYNELSVETPSQLVLASPDDTSITWDFTGPSIQTFNDFVAFDLIRNAQVGDVDRITINLSLFFNSLFQVPYKFNDWEEFFEFESTVSNADLLNQICTQLNAEYGNPVNRLSFTSTIGSNAQHNFGNFNTVGANYLDCTVVGNQLRIQLVTEVNIPSGTTFAITDQHLMVSASVETNYLIGSTFKRGAKHNTGIVYSDDGGRVSTVLLDQSGSTLSTIQDSSFYVDWYHRTPGQEGSVDLNLFVSHQPPEWATKWQVVMSKNRNVRDFVQFSSNSLEAVSGRLFKISLTNLLNYGVNVNANINYTFTRGDRLRFIKDKNGEYFNEYFEMEVVREEIIGTDHFVFIREPELSTSLYSVSDFVLNATTPDIDNYFTFEIFTPFREVEKFIFFETGEVHPVINPGQIDRTHGLNVNASKINEYISPQMGVVVGGVYSNTNAAQILLRDVGDTYLKSRFHNGDGVGIDEVVESYRFSDFFNSFSWNQGRGNIEDKDYRRIRRETTVRYSEPFIPDTNINGLSTFLDNSFETYDWQYGSIQKVHPEDGQIICFQELKVGRILVSERVMYDSQGNINAIVGSQDNQVLHPKMVYYQGEFGISKNPESFAVYGGSKYFTDANRGVVLRLGGNGLVPISHNKMSVYFENKFNNLINSGERFFVRGVFDVDFDNYIVSFEELSKNGVLIEQADTVSFNETENRWKSHWPYHPEHLSSYNINIVTFLNGHLYTHNTNSTYNNYYGVQYNSIIKFLSNIEPASIKFYKSLYVEATDVFVLEEATNQFGQETNLMNRSDWEIHEGVYYADMLRDINSGGTFAFPLLEGDVMRCHSMTLCLVNDSTSLQRLFLVNIRSERSMLTNY